VHGIDRCAVLAQHLAGDDELVLHVQLRARAFGHLQHPAAQVVDVGVVVGALGAVAGLDQVAVLVVDVDGVAGIQARLVAVDGGGVDAGDVVGVGLGEGVAVAVGVAAVGAVDEAVGQDVAGVVVGVGLGGQALGRLKGRAGVALPLVAGRERL
jgi:hypothetical protein